MNRANANLALNIALAVGVAATLIGGLVFLFADSRAPPATATPSSIAVYVSGAVGEHKQRCDDRVH